jgi:hypothetical protein
MNQCYRLNPMSLGWFVLMFLPNLKFQMNRLNQCFRLSLMNPCYRLSLMTQCFRLSLTNQLSLKFLMNHEYQMFQHFRLNQ